MTDADLRAEARRRLGARRDFVRTMVVFAVVAVLLVGIWAFTTPGLYFWPAWPIGGLVIAAIFMALHTTGVLGGEPSRSAVDAEVERMRRRSG